MRVLFVANEQPDFLQDVVFHGLITELGPDNVIDCPRIVRYRSPPPEGTPFPMLWFGLPPRESVDVLDALAEVDAVVIASLREGALPFARRLLEAPRRVPIAFVDGEDDPYVRAVVGSVDRYFKRETLLRGDLRRRLAPLRRRPVDDPLRRRVGLATRRSRRILPLPLGIVQSGIEPSAEKRYDVTFLGSLTSPERALLREQLAVLAGEGVRVCAQLGDERPLGWGDYMEALSSSRVGISVRGLGYDTYRYWETPYAGAALVAEEPRIVVPENFVAGVEAVFAAPEGLVERARALLDSGADGELAGRGREKLLARHTSAHRARVVLDALTTRR